MARSTAPIGVDAAPATMARTPASPRARRDVVADHANGVSSLADGLFERATLTMWSVKRNGPDPDTCVASSQIWVPKSSIWRSETGQ